MAIDRLRVQKILFVSSVKSARWSVAANQLAETCLFLIFFFFFENLNAVKNWVHLAEYLQTPAQAQIVSVSV